MLRNVINNYLVTLDITKVGGMQNLVIIIASILTLFVNYSQAQKSFYNGSGSVQFLSEAPLETIKAESDALNGIINIEEKTFAFSFRVNTFQGFNSPLQQEHFKDYYLETKAYPKASFVGKLIGWEECEADCNQTINAKGKFTIKGITKILNIPVNIIYTYEDDAVNASCEFDILLSDYNINIPIILEAKISPIIKVSVNVDFVSTDE